ncbi:Rz1-like lysis system protein LysC [Leminorella grimontii]|uniref:Rz1-like lysis system protein LysC n=1 Tax=Leminorella grimontii TaxID=82981 RepID=UPI003BB915DE
MKRSAQYRVLASACLTLLLSGCASESMPSTPLPLPDSLLRPCLAPEYRVKTYGDYPGYVAELLAALEQCNRQLQGITQLEQKK